MPYIEKALMAIWIILLPFQDSGLQSVPIGFLGASPAFIPIIILIFVYIFQQIASNHWVKIRKVNFYVVFYMLAVTVFYLFFSGTESHGRNLVLKSINLFILTVLFLFPIFYIKYDAIKISKYIQIAFLITILGVLFTDVLEIAFFADKGIFHFFPNTNMRPRGFSLESSTLSVMLVTLGLLCAHYAKRKIVRYAYLSVMLTALFFSGSKGGIVILMLVGTVVYYIKHQSLKWIKPLMFLSVIIVNLLVGVFIIDKLTVDIEEYTSIATRLSMAITSVVISFYNPMGVGFSGFLPAVNEYAPLSMTAIEQVFAVKFNFAEVLSYVSADSDQAVSSKTFLFDYLAFFGIPFVISFFLFNYCLMRQLLIRKYTLLFVNIAYCFLSLCTYNSGLGFYDISLVYGVAFYEIYRKKTNYSSTGISVSSESRGAGRYLGENKELKSDGI